MENETYKDSERELLAADTKEVLHLHRHATLPVFTSF